MRNSPLAGKSALVSGESGFLGSHLVCALLDAGARVIALARPNSDLWRLETILDRIEVRRDYAPADFVFHLAAAGVQPGASPEALLENIALTHALLEGAARCPPRRFLHAGSCFEYPSGHRIPETTPPAPRSLYGVSKAASWMLVNSYSARLPVVTLRPFTLYGPLEADYRLIPSSIQAALSGVALPLTGGTQTRDFLFVKDAAQAFVAAASAELVSGETFNLGTGRAIPVRAAVEQIFRACGSAARPAFGSLPDRAGEHMQLGCDPSKANRLLGWTAATSFDSGIEQTIRSRARKLLHA